MHNPNLFKIKKECRYDIVYFDSYVENSLHSIPSSIFRCHTTFELINQYVFIFETTYETTNKNTYNCVKIRYLKRDFIFRFLEEGVKHLYFHNIIPNFTLYKVNHAIDIHRIKNPMGSYIYATVKDCKKIHLYSSTTESKHDANFLLFSQNKFFHNEDAHRLAEQFIYDAVEQTK